VQQLAAQQTVGEVSRRGGWRGSPNSIAALMRYQILAPDQRKCRRCRKFALRGEDRCRRHVGRGAPWRLLSPAQGRGESRMLARLERVGLLPLELLVLPVWRNLQGIRTSERAPQRLALVLAWDKRYKAPLHWAQVQRQAMDLALKYPGSRQPTAYWYENL